MVLWFLAASFYWCLRLPDQTGCGCLQFVLPSLFFSARFN